MQDQAQLNAGSSAGTVVRNAVYLTSSRALEEQIEIARERGRVGLDLEFLRERTYYPEIALIQMAVEESYFLIDPLDKSLDLTPLYKLVADPEVVKILHAASQDLEIFNLLSEQIPQTIFDTQIAAAFVGIGQQISYAGLVDRCLGQNLPKGESFTDWLARPLSPKQESYALDDVRYLIPVYEDLVGQLESLGRTDWVRQECRRYEGRAFYELDWDELYSRVKRQGTLRPRPRAILQELAVWREHEAQRRNIPRRRVISDEALVEIARSQPKEVGAIERIRGLHPREAKRSGRALLETIQRGREVDDQRFRNDESRLKLSETETLVSDLISSVLKTVSAEASISPGTVCNNRDINELIRLWKAGKTGEHLLLRGWRRDLVGQPVLDFLEGRLSIYVDPESKEPRFTQRS